MRIAVVKAAFDDAAAVWHVERSDIEGLHVEEETFEAFRQNVATATADLLFEDGDENEDVHIEIVAHASVRARAAHKDGVSGTRHRR